MRKLYFSRIRSQAVSLALLLALCGMTKASTVSKLEIALSTEAKTAIVYREYLTSWTSNCEATLRVKKYDLELFEAFLFERLKRKPTINDLNPALIKSFIVERQRFGDCAMTINRRLATIKAFCSELEKRLVGFHSPAANVCGVHCSKKIFRGLTEQQVLELRKTVQPGKLSRFSDVRDWALIETLLGTGLRRSELASLTLSQLNEQGCSLYDVLGKGNRMRSIYLNSHLIETLRVYCNVRQSELLAHDPLYKTVLDAGKWPLFVSFYGAKPGQAQTYRLSTERINSIVKERCLAAGIPRKFAHAHTLRHTFGHALYKAADRDLTIVADALGHSSIEITRQYASATEQEKQNAMEKLYNESKRS